MLIVNDNKTNIVKKKFHLKKQSHFHLRSDHKSPPAAVAASAPLQPLDDGRDVAEVPDGGRLPQRGEGSAAAAFGVEVVVVAVFPSVAPPVAVVVPLVGEVVIDAIRLLKLIN